MGATLVPIAVPLIWIKCSSLKVNGQSAELEVELANSATRKQVDVKNEDGKKEKLFLFYDGETVSGKVPSSIN